MTIDNKVAIVTGASSGIGMETAKLLAKNGAKVALVARSKDKLEALSKEISGSLVVITDMTRPEEIKEMIKKVKEHFGRIDILINNAGQGYDVPVEEVDMETAKRIYDLDVFGPLIAMQEIIPIMKAQKEGSIINVSSGTALMAISNMSVYSSAKRAIAQISLVAREELEKNGIKVSVVYPYVTDTEFEKNTVRGKDIKFYPSWIKYLPHPPDSAEFAANLIIRAIKSSEAEVYAHNWLKKL